MHEKNNMTNHVLDLFWFILFRYLFNLTYGRTAVSSTGRAFLQRARTGVNTRRWCRTGRRCWSCCCTGTCLTRRLWQSSRGRQGFYSRRKLDLRATAHTQTSVMEKRRAPAIKLDGKKRGRSGKRRRHIIATGRTSFLQVSSDGGVESLQLSVGASILANWL